VKEIKEIKERGMKVKADRHTIISLIILVLAFSMGIIIGSYLMTPEWQCPRCGFDDADSIVPVINDQYAEAVKSEIDSAKSSIDIMMYMMKYYETNNSLMMVEKALIAAKERGVKVRIILDSEEENGKPSSLTKENMKALDYLSENGIEVKFDSPKTTTHDKLLIIDGETVIIGSHNWGFSAFERNNEASVIIKDAEIAAYYENYFENLWEKYQG